jgi:hypothetical protein
MAILLDGWRSEQCWRTYLLCILWQGQGRAARRPTVSRVTRSKPARIFHRPQKFFGHCTSINAKCLWSADMLHIHMHVALGECSVDTCNYAIMRAVGQTRKVHKSEYPQQNWFKYKTAHNYLKPAVCEGSLSRRFSSAHYSWSRDMQPQQGNSTSVLLCEITVQLVRLKVINAYNLMHSLTLWSRSSSKCYLRIQSVPQREHHTSRLQRSTG